MKKLLLSLGSVAATVTPVAAVIACGNKTSKSDELVSKLGLTLGKQDADGVVLEIKTDDLANKVSKGKYYLTKDQLAVGQTFKVISTEDGETITLKVVTKIVASNGIGASLETVPATGTGQALTAGNVDGVAGDANQFFGTWKNGVVLSLANAQEVADDLKYVLQTKAPEKLFDNAENKKLLKEAVNKILKGIGKEISADDAFTFTPPTLGIAKLDATAKASTAEVFEDLTLAKQKATDFVLEFKAAAANDIQTGKYYFDVAKLAANQEIEVLKTDGSKLKLKVVTAITAAGTSKGASLTLEDGTTTLAAAGVDVIEGDTNKFVATTNGISKSLDDDAAIITELKAVLEAKAPEKLIDVKKDELVESINKILSDVDKQVTKDDLIITNPTVTIDETKIADIA